MRMDTQPLPGLSALNINTITAGTKLGIREFPRDKKILFDIVEIFNNIEIGETNFGIIGAKIEINGQHITRGEVPLKRMSKAKRERVAKLPKTKMFQNSITLRLRSRILITRVVNVLLFRTGSLTIAGAISEPDFIDISKRVAKAVRRLYIHNFKIFTGIDDIPKDLNFFLHTHSIRMINSDYQTGIQYTRRSIKKIIDILINKYGLVVEYEPNKYVGIKTHYTTSEGNPIFISYFRTGSVLVKGGKSILGVTETYEMFNNILRNERALFEIPDVVTQSPRVEA